MELFKYRNLTFASFSFLVTLFVSYYFNNTVRIAILVLTGVAFLSLILTLAISRGKYGLRILIRFTPSFILVLLALVLSLIHFDNSEIESYCDEKEHEITAVIDTVSYGSDSFSTYEIELLEIDGYEIDKDITMTAYSAPVSERTVVKATGHFVMLDSVSGSGDVAGYFLSHGITVQFQSNTLTAIGTSEMRLVDYLRAGNKELDFRLSAVGDDTTYRMLSALFLGNKNNLDNEVQRDFSRIGLSHVLALSGMHIAIIVTILGYALYLFPIHRIAKEIILILSTIFFVGITGFSESALRAGLMVSLTYTLFFFGNRLSLTTSLFYSATLICIVNPYSIFSLSLQLSVSAMLGCIYSSKVIHRVRFLRRLKPRPLRYFTYTAFTSLIICLFTLPLVSTSFGRISLLSPVSNILLGPLFSVLIFLSPVYLLLADVPFVSEGIAWICKGLTHASVSLGGSMASGDNVCVPITSVTQFAGIIIFVLFLFCMLVLGKRTYKYMKIGAALGISVFVCGTVMIFCQRELNAYASVHSFVSSDVIAVEDSGDITVIDIAATSSAYPESAVTSLGYYEIDNYVILNCSSKAVSCFERLSSNVIIRRVYLKAPNDEKEAMRQSTICSIASEKGIDVQVLTNQIQMERSSISFANKSRVPGSTKPAIALSVECDNTVFTYLGAGTFELYDNFISDSAFRSDAIVFGACGPKYKTPFNYQVPYLKYAVFLGNSWDFATEELRENTKNVKTNETRFRLTS